MSMTRELLKNFPPSFTPNKSQINLLTGIQEAFDQGHKFVICCAPTGSGKSFITKTLSHISDQPSAEYCELVNSYVAFKQRHSGGYVYEDECNDTPSFGTFALTITKTLQDQYNSLFSDIKVLKGKSNYQCAIDDNYNVEVAPCMLTKGLKEDCWSKNKCPYYNARNESLTTRLATLNYNMFFALPKHLKKRQYIVCDEASELEDQLVKQFACTVKFSFLKKHEINIQPFNSTNYNSANRWIGNLLIQIDSKIEDLKEQIQREKKEHIKNFKSNELIALRNLHTKLATIIDTWDECEYVFETSFEGIVFTPLRVNNLSKYIFDYGDRVVLMSATIIDHKNFCKTLGIDKYKYIEVDSSFDPKNAPIYANTKVKLSFNNLKQNLPKLKKQILDICEHHKLEKGLIHTHTNTITAYLKSQIDGERFLFREPGTNNETLLDKHYKTKEPTVLISPSMSHGVDLKDDLARFQIIIKAPYLPIKNKRIERLMSIDSNWYTNKMLAAVIQSCGRGIRTSSDHCVTYILDGSIVEKIISNKDKLPKYFLDRFI
jgi:ATP-dependent DNA helicase DinG